VTEGQSRNEKVDDKSWCQPKCHTDALFRQWADGVKMADKWHFNTA